MLSTATTLADLPPDVLAVIGTRVASGSRDIAVSSRDAASCALAAPRRTSPLAEIAASAWKQIDRVAETIGSIEAYRQSYGAEHTSMRKRDIFPLARAACSWVRGTTALWQMKAILAQEIDIGVHCPIRRPAALLVLGASRSFVARSPHPPAFRDRDLARCPVHAIVRGSRRIRIRDALCAPKLDFEARTDTRAEANDALDREFRDAGFVRGWCETDLPARRRMDYAQRWACRVDAHPCIAATIVAMARRGEVKNYDTLETVNAAYRHAGVSPSPRFTWSLYTWESHPDRLLSETRGDIYSRIQIRAMGIIAFRLDPSIMPTLSATEIDSACARVLAYSLLFRDACAIGGDDARTSILNAVTINDANATIERILAQSSAIESRSS